MVQMIVEGTASWLTPSPLSLYSLSHLLSSLPVLLHARKSLWLAMTRLQHSFPNIIMRYSGHIETTMTTCLIEQNIKESLEKQQHHPDNNIPVYR